MNIVKMDPMANNESLLTYNLSVRLNFAYSSMKRISQFNRS
jgi:hypothetical protein